MVTNSNRVTVLQRMFFDQLAVDVGPVRAVQIFEERIVEDVDDQRVMAADGRIVDTNIVIREPANGIALLVHVVFGHSLAVEAENQPSHASALTEPTKNAIDNIATRRETIQHVCDQHRDVVTASVVVGKLNQLFSNRI